MLLIVIEILEKSFRFLKAQKAHRNRTRPPRALPRAAIMLEKGVELDYKRGARLTSLGAHCSSQSSITKRTMARFQNETTTGLFRAPTVEIQDLSLLCDFKEVD